MMGISEGRTEWIQNEAKREEREIKNARESVR